MIVPMKKATLLILKNEQRQALKDLRKLGLVHVEDKPAYGAVINELRAEKNNLMMVQSLLTEYLPKKKTRSTEPSIMSEADTLSFVASVLDLTAAYKSNTDELSKLKGELRTYEEWGSIDPKDFERLGGKNVHLFPASLSEKLYAALPKSVKTVLVNKSGGKVRFLIWSDTAEIPETLPKELTLLKMPDISVKEMRDKIKTLSAKTASYKTEMTKMSAYINSLQALDEAVSKRLRFELVHEGMSEIRLSEKEDGSAELVSLTGYVPAEDEKQVLDLAKEKAWACILQEPAEEDPVPTKLRNNRFVNLISPLTEFLGTIPGYTEPDISLWFLLFFGIFFAMIFGDAGYGALLILIALGLMAKIKSKKKKIPTALYMTVYLGIMTVIWGTLVCNWFGIDPKQGYIPAFLMDLSIPAISNITEESVRNRNQMLLCFTLGLAQLSIAHIIGILRNIKSPKFLADAGSLGMLGGMYIIVLNLVVDSEKYVITPLVLYAVGIGFVLNFMFANYSESIGRGLVESSKNTINMLLGVVNVFADIMSYIRLWAVGLAGGAISSTVNQMAGPALGGFIIFLGVLLLVFGHGLNYIMNVLSVIVHGVRLNTLEFSNHLGLTWSGFKYEPFNE